MFTKSVHANESEKDQLKKKRNIFFTTIVKFLVCLNAFYNDNKQSLKYSLVKKHTIYALIFIID